MPAQIWLFSLATARSERGSQANLLGNRVRGSVSVETSPVVTSIASTVTVSCRSRLRCWHTRTKATRPSGMAEGDCRLVRKHRSSVGTDSGCRARSSGLARQSVASGPGAVGFRYQLTTIHPLGSHAYPPP